MFTGIIHASGIVESFQRLEWGARLRLRTADDAAGDVIYTRGESVAVNGVCLTALPEADGSIVTDVSQETLSRTTLGTLGNGARVNVERALAVGDRLGGHIVQGHVDTVGALVSISSEGDFAMYRWSFPPEHVGLVVNKGSIAVDGVSLTIVDPLVSPDSATFAAALIPETLRRTNLGAARIGDAVNLEFDMIAKYIRNLVSPYLSSTLAARKPA